MFAVSRGVSHRGALDPMLLWLWCRPAATALIRLLAWEPPYAMGAVLKRQRKRKETVSPDENPHFFFFFKELLNHTYYILELYII